MELIQNYIIDSKVYIQLFPVFIGLIVFKYFNLDYKLFIALLFYSVSNEIFKIYYGTYIDIGQNKILSNIHNVVYFGFLFWLFYKRLDSNLLKRIIVIISFLYVVSVGYELQIQKINYHNQSQVVSFIAGGFGVLICVFLYFSSLLNSKQSIKFSSDLLFWIAIAHFIYYLGFVPFKAGENYFAAFEKYHYLFNIKIPVTILKSIILSIGLILCGRQKAQ